MSEPAGDVTRFLRDFQRGDLDAADGRLPEVVATLRRIAHRQLVSEAPGRTLDTVALVNEAYLKMAGAGGREWESRSHFYGSAARAMRQILVSYARARNAQKRGGGAPDVPLDDVLLFLDGARSDELVALDEALARLEEAVPRHVRVVECRFFVGLSVEETAEALGVSPATVTRDWRTARAWLRQALAPDPPADP